MANNNKETLKRFLGGIPLTAEFVLAGETERQPGPFKVLSEDAA